MAPPPCAAIWFAVQVHQDRGVAPAAGKNEPKPNPSQNPQFSNGRYEKHQFRSRSCSEKTNPNFDATLHKRSAQRRPAGEAGLRPDITNQTRMALSILGRTPNRAQAGSGDGTGRAAGGGRSVGVVGSAGAYGDAVGTQEIRVFWCFPIKAVEQLLGVHHRGLGERPDGRTLHALVGQDALEAHGGHPLALG